jgi:hypothetical protein
MTIHASPRDHNPNRPSQDLSPNSSSQGTKRSHEGRNALGMTQYPHLP